MCNVHGQWKNATKNAISIFMVAVDDVEESVLMLIAHAVMLPECVFLVFQKCRLDFLNMRSVSTLAVFSITQRISTFCLYNIDQCCLRIRKEINFRP
jgi:hypothetical protein